jgi:hypothetical protein
MMLILMLTRTEDLIEEMSSPQIPTSQRSGLMILFKALAFCCFLFLELCWFCLCLAATFKSLSGWTYLFWLCSLFWLWNDLPYLGPLVVLVAVHQSVTTPRSLSPFLIQ